MHRSWLGPGSLTHLNARFRSIHFKCGVVAAAIPLVLGILNATQSQAQSQTQNTVARSLVYDVVSIKPNKSGNEMATLTASRNGFIGTSITLLTLIGDAYRVEDHRISGAPQWLKSEKYDIEAKMDGSTADELRKLTKDQMKIERLRMLQSLLSDRLKLTVHRETKELPIYALVVAKDGPKLHEAKPGDTYPNGIKGPDGIGGPGMNVQTIGAGGRSELIGQGLTMASLVGLLSEQLHRTVLDKTGLTGTAPTILNWSGHWMRAKLRLGSTKTRCLTHPHLILQDHRSSGRFKISSG